MSNYLFDLITKSFNLIDTVQPLVLSVFEPLPEDNLDWEPSITTESTELETTSQTDRFPNFEILQSLEWRSPATNLQISEEITNPFLTNFPSTPVQASKQILKSIPNLAHKPDLELFSNWPFLESLLTKISTKNQEFTSDAEDKTSTTPLIFAQTKLLQKKQNKINPVVSVVQPSNVVNWQPFPNQPFQKSEILSATVNQIVPNSNTERLKSILVPQTKTSLSNRFFSVQPIETDISLSNPISKQSQLTHEFLPQQPIGINRLSLSLQLPIKSDLQIPFNENPTKPVIFPFDSQEKTFSQPSLNTTILRTAIANKNNSPVSKLVGEKSGELTTKLLNNQSVEINRTASLYPLAKVLNIKQSLPEIQPETSTILSMASVLKPRKSVTENLHKQPTEINPVFIHSQLPQSENSEAFLPQLQSEELTAIPLVSFANAFAITQLSPLTPVITVETNTPSSTLIQPQQQLVSEPSQKRFLQTGNISTLEVLLNQIIAQPKAIPTLREPLLYETLRERGTPSFANASAITQESPLIPTIPIKTNTPSSTLIQPQQQLASEPSQKRFLQTENISTSEILSSQIIEQLTAIPLVSSANAPAIHQVLPLIPVLTVDTSTLALSPVIQPEIAPVAIASIIDRTLSNLHKQSLTPTIATETIAEPQEKLTFNLPRIQQIFAHKNVSSMQPLLSNGSAKLSSLQTNSSTTQFVDNLSSSITSQPTTQLTAINSDIIPTPALYPLTSRTDIQSQINFSDSHLSNFHRETASAQEVGSQNYNRSDRKHIAIQKVGVVEQWDELGQVGEEMNVNYAHYPVNMQHHQIAPHEGTLTSLVENLILPQNVSPNLSMSADRGRDRVESSYFRQLEESDLRPLSEPINDFNVKNLSVIARSSKKLQKRWRSPSQTSPFVNTPPAIQVTIDKLEIRSAAPPPPPRPKPRPAPSVMSLNEYLQRRARRG